MLPVADVNGVSVLTAMSAHFSISHVITFTLSIIIGRHPMLLVADVFHMANSSAEIANDLRSINRDISGFEIEIRRNIT